MRYCEVCTQTVHVGLGGDKNFTQHEAGKKHQKRLAAQPSSSSVDNVKRQTAFMVSFFVKKPPSPGPSTTQRPVVMTSAAPTSLIPRPQVPFEQEMIDIDSFPDIAGPPNEADNLLKCLQILTSNLPDSVLLAGPEDVFAHFAHDPCGEVEEGEDLYETIVDRVLSNAVGYKKQADDVAQLICCGPLGMDAFCRWIEICLVDLSISTELLEV